MFTHIREHETRLELRGLPIIEGVEQEGLVNAQKKRNQARLGEIVAGIAPHKRARFMQFLEENPLHRPY